MATLYREIASAQEALARDLPARIVARLERLPVSRFHVRARVLIGAATFFDAYTSLAIAYALPPLVRLWHLAPQNIGLIISAGYLGQLVGALVFGALAERWGRLRVATITVAIFGLMSIACIFAWDAWSLSAFRLIQGIGVGGEVPVASAYINEFASARRRGRFFIFYEMLFAFGLAGAGLAGYALVPVYGWQAMFTIGVVPAVLVIIFRQYLPESPRWLLSKGRVAEADAIVGRIERDIERRGTVLPAPAELGVQVPPEPPMAAWRELFSGIYRRRTFMVWSLWVFSYLIVNGLTTWLPTLYSSVFRLPLSTAFLYGLTTNNVALVASVLCALYIDRLGRRRWYIMSFFVSVGPLTLLCLLGAGSAVEVLVLATCGYFLIGTISMSLYLYTGELYPTRIRAFGSSIASAWLRLASAISPVIVGFILAGEGLRWVFAYFAAIAAIGGIVCLLFMMETKGRVLEELSP